MRQKPYEIVILKPTAAFLSYLALQLPAAKLPDLRLLNIDNTAYVLPKNDLSVVVEAQKHFQWMFQYEVKRWLGEEPFESSTLSFVDFLSYFKLEIYNHIVLMEPSIQEGTQLLMLKPRQALLDWACALFDKEDSLEDVMARVDLAHLQENSTVIVKNFSNLTSIQPFIKHYYQPLYSTAISRLFSHSHHWPSVNSFQAFKQYFALEIHTKLIHLS